MSEKPLFISISALLFILTFITGILLFNTFFGDPTIYLVYAKNIAKGDFFSFNSRSFSSGSTSPLWALILSISFLFDDDHGVIISKIVSFLSTLIALIFSFITLFQISKNKIGSILGTFSIAYFLLIPGIMLYESSLTVILISSLLYILNNIVNTVNHRIVLEFFLLTLVLSLIPLTRPDAIILIIICSAVLFHHYLAIKQKKLVFLVVVIILISLIPSMIYFGYSYLKIGVFSVSSYCRSFALKENASSFLDFSYSLSTLKYFMISPKFIYVIMAIIGIKKILYFYKYKSLAYFLIISITSYFIILTFIYPITEDVGRYFLPVIPLLALGITFFIKHIFETKKIIIVIIFSTFIVGYAFYGIFPSVFNHRSRGLDFNTIVEKNIIHKINSLAEKNSSILVYEVQDRYYLRDDITLLSLDGIIDGKVAPYLNSGDMYTFLLKYKPDYWLANDAVNYRKYLKNSVLNKVYNEIVLGGMDSISIDRITFKKLMSNIEKTPPGFASYRILFKLSYKN